MSQKFANVAQLHAAPIDMVRIPLHPDTMLGDHFGRVRCMSELAYQLLKATPALSRGEVGCVFCHFGLGAGTVRVGHSTDCRWEAGVHPLLRSALPEDWTGRRAGVRQRVVAFTCGGIMALQQGLGVRVSRPCATASSPF